MEYNPSPERLIEDPNVGLFIIKPQQTVEEYQKIETILEELISKQGFSITGRFERTLIPKDIMLINPEIFADEAVSANQDEESDRFRDELTSYLSSGSSIGLVVSGQNARTICSDIKAEIRESIAAQIGHSEQSYRYADIICNYIHVPEPDEYEDSLQLFLEATASDKNRIETGLEHFKSVYEQVRFTDWESAVVAKAGLERVVENTFPGYQLKMKLIGSAATGTMRKNHEDLDFAVAFSDAVDGEDFIGVIEQTGLQLTEVSWNEKYGYVRVCGRYEGFDFVLVPMRHPEGEIKGYDQDAFYHADFINLRKPDNHQLTTVLLKAFFEQVGVYKEIKGIGCEMMALYFQDFGGCINYLATHDSLRINYSDNHSEYTESTIVIDYPFLGGRSLTNEISAETYQRIQNAARELIDDPYWLGAER